MSNPASAGRGRRSSGDPYGVAAARPFLAPLLSLAGLAVIGLVTLGLLTGNLPFLPSRTTGGPGGGGGGPVVPGQTPSASAPPVVNPGISIDGRLVYAKAGNLWIQEGSETRQLTTTGRDSQPAWSADGAWVYFIETRHTRVKYPIQGLPVIYELDYPILTRIRPDGTDRTSILSGLYRTGSAGQYAWAFFIRDPAVAPDGQSVAVVSDGPDPTRSDVVLGLVRTSNGKLTPLGLAEQPPYGHQDPAWRPDGTALLYVRNARVDGRGAPAIWRYDTATKKASQLSRAGYTEPSWSPDGRYLAATKTSTLGTDVVILDARNGNELLRVTSDGRSWGGAWSPDGTRIAFLQLAGSTTDLRLARIARGPGATLSVADVEPLTEFSGLDPESRPAWWGPPPPSPTPAPATPAPATPPTSASP